MQFSPSSPLSRFVKNYSVISIETPLADEVFYPSGFIDLVINISGSAATTIGRDRRETPAVELLGHLTVPTRVSAAKGTTLIIARLFPYAGGLLLPGSIRDFTDQATDLRDVFSATAREIHERVASRTSVLEKVRELDAFLLREMKRNERRYEKAAMLADIYAESLSKDTRQSTRDLSDRYGFSTRYLQRLFIENVGVSSATLSSLVRFNDALELVRATDRSLTDIAYDCGYYDQAHFIRAFRSFTGVAPSAARSTLAAGGAEFQTAVNIGF